MKNILHLTNSIVNYTHISEEKSGTFLHICLKFSSCVLAIPANKYITLDQKLSLPYLILCLYLVML